MTSFFKIIIKELYWGVWRRMKKRGCSNIYTKDPQVEIMEVRLLQIRFFKMGIIGLHFSRMHIHMYESAKYAKLQLGEKLDWLFRYKLSQSANLFNNGDLISLVRSLQTIQSNKNIFSPLPIISLDEHKQFCSWRWEKMT